MQSKNTRSEEFSSTRLFYLKLHTIPTIFYFVQGVTMEAENEKIHGENGDQVEEQPNSFNHINSLQLKRKIFKGLKKRVKDTKSEKKDN